MNLISKIAIGVAIPVMIIIGLFFGSVMYDNWSYQAEKSLQKECNTVPDDQEEYDLFIKKCSKYYDAEKGRWINP